MEELLDPEVSSWATLFATLIAELSSDPELSVDVARLLRGLYVGFSGDGVGGVTVEGRVSIFTLGVEWAHGFEVFNAAIAWSTWVWLVGGGGVWVDVGLGLAGRVLVEGLGVALLHSTLPSGKFSL